MYTININKLGTEGFMVVRAIMLIDTHGGVDGAKIELDSIYITSMEKAVNSNTDFDRDTFIDLATGARNLREFIIKVFEDEKEN